MNLLETTSKYPSYLGIQRTYNFEVILPSLYNMLVDGWFVSRFCQSVKVGQYDLNSVEIKRGARNLFFPDSTVLQPAYLTFVAPVPDVVSLYFNTWRDLIINKKGLYGLASQYKKRVYVILFDRTGIPSNMIVLKGAWPITFPKYDDLAYATEDVKKHEITLRFDDISFDFEALGQVISDVQSGVKSVASKLINK